MNLEALAQKLSDHIDYEEKRDVDREKYDGLVMNKLDGIIERQDYTNGNVKDLLLARAYGIGALAVITALVVPLIIYIWQNK